MRSVFGRHLLQFFAIDGIEKTVPKPSGDSEVHVRVLMMNEVVGPQFSIPSIFEVEVMMGVMNDAVKNESSQRARHETQDEVELQSASQDIPRARHESCNHEPWHCD